MAEILSPTVRQAIDRMDGRDLERLRRAPQTRECHGDSRFSVQDGNLIVITGSLKRDLGIVRVFKRLFSSAYRARDNALKLAQNQAFQRLVTEKATDVAPQNVGPRWEMRGSLVPKYIREAMMTSQSQVRGGLTREGLSRSRVDSVTVWGCMQKGRDESWQTQLPVLESRSTQELLAEVPAPKAEALRQRVDDHVQRELRHDPKMRVLLEAAGGFSGSAPEVAQSIRESIVGYTRRKTDEVLQDLLVQSWEATGEARVDQMMAALGPAPAGQP